MSNDIDKFNHSKRILKSESAVCRQVKIAKSRSYTSYDRVIQQPHRLAKRHAMDCGRPGCMLCGNPRRTDKDKLTVQEKRMLQEITNAECKCSNGTLPMEDQ
jgi:hypothetical protein